MNQADSRIANVEAECAMLGGLMISNQLIDKAADIVKPADFADPFLGMIFSAICREHSLNRVVNPVTLKPYFDGHPALAELGGIGFLARLTGSGAAVIGTLDMAEQIAELGARRRLSERLLESAAECENYERSLDELAGLVETALGDALDTDGGSQTMSASDAVAANLDAQFGEAPGVQCGLIPSLDLVLGAICPGDLIILASRPGMGKTALSISYGHGVSARGDGVTMISLEMRGPQLGGRLACDMLFGTPEAVPYAAVSENRCTVEQRRSMARAALALRDMPFWIEDLPGATIGRLGAIVRKHKRRLAARGKTLKLVIVDYLQLLAPDHRAKNLYEATSMVSRGLKALAKAEGVGVLALCQLSREVEKRTDRRPTLSDLRDSGQIEQDADSICFLLRNEEYLKREEPHPDHATWIDWRHKFDQQRGKIEFIVAKRRAGRSGIGHGLWHGEYQAVRG